MPSEFEVIQVPTDAPDAQEPMGTKLKFWFDHPSLGRCLYKQGRENTGEDWAEKVASELAEMLVLPHARVELAVWTDASGAERRGIVSPSFVPPGGALVHGNEVLREILAGYPGRETSPTRLYRIPQHTIGAVGGILDQAQIAPPLDWPSSPVVGRGVDVFVGYLLLDAWIGNTDRHHENWAWIIVWHPDSSVTFHLAPTYDHASSLGRNETDDTRRRRLSTRDRGFSVAAYVDRATSAFYRTEQESRPLSTCAAFEEAAQRYPHAARFWLQRLADVGDEQPLAILRRLPLGMISEPAIEFACEMLKISRIRLLQMGGLLP
ncbi:MAG: hypothetical protein HY718_14120 [Planctomycetes bacterium]|nr:hypothetical protein [Planctomycetota bacterium]